MVVQVNPKDIRSMVETIKIADMTLKVRVKGIIPCCHKCGVKGHIRADCPLPLGKTKEMQESEK